MPWVTPVGVVEASWPLASRVYPKLAMVVPASVSVMVLAWSALSEVLVAVTPLPETTEAGLLSGSGVRVLVCPSQSVTVWSRPASS